MTAIFLAGCDTSSPPAPPITQAESRPLESTPTSFPDSHYQTLEQALVTWGYVLGERSEPQPTAWERETFGLLHKRVVSMRSRHVVPGESNTYYRFTLTEEIYPDGLHAKQRLEQLFVKPPDFDVQNQYSFRLRKGYQRESAVYVLGTDAALFQEEMLRLATQLRGLDSSLSQ